MTVCNDIHEEIVFDGGNCPLCALCDLLKERDMALGRLDEEKTQLEGRIDDLEQQVDAYRSELKI